MQLKELAGRIAASRIVGDGGVEFGGIQTDSRKVRPGDLFVCIPGFTQDGHDYAAEAAGRGAVALVAERETGAGLPFLLVKDSRRAMGLIASHFYGYPSRQLKLIGVTGTNGKTTVTFLIDRILSDRGHRTGLLGTIHTKIAGEISAAERTTQEALDLQRVLRVMADRGVEYCTMEVSSHALELGRVNGCRFRIALFTNLTRDHLDFHGTMERYRDAKGLFFSRLGNDYGPDPGEDRFAVLNADDPVSEYYARLTAAQIVTYGIEKSADVRASEIRTTLSGTAFRLESFAGTAEIRMKLVGRFNVYNALAAAAAALAEGIPLEAVSGSLEAADPVEGRMETVNAGQDFLVLVDYAHTPDGLENALRSISEFAEGNVITVFGCGGDRDKTKRPIMGRIAAEYSDLVIVTSDNPRSEDPEAIIRDIERGLLEAGFPKDRYRIMPDRREAIRAAVREAGRGDVVLIAGKGHETYQILRDRTIAFDDRTEAAEAIRSLDR